MSNASILPEVELYVDETVETSNSSSDSCNEARLKDRHWTMLILSIGILLISWVLAVGGSSAGDALFWQGFRLPVLCGSRAFLGVECPGCGLSRSFVALASGDIALAYQYHRLGWLMWIAVVLQIPFRLYCLWELQTMPLKRNWPIWFGNFLIVALISNWLFGLIF